jgi:hypothetical protein
VLLVLVLIALVLVLVMVELELVLEEAELALEEVELALVLIPAETRFMSGVPLALAVPEFEPVELLVVE